MAPSESGSSPLEDALKGLTADLRTCHTLENALRGRRDCPDQPRSRNGKPVRKRSAPDAPTDTKPDNSLQSMASGLDAVVAKCKETREQAVADAGPAEDTSDTALAQHTRHTDGVALGVYAKFLHYVPRLVNVVTVSYTAF